MTKEDFFTHYDSLTFKQKKSLRKRIVKACMIEPPTWYGWMQKRAIPKPSQKLIALELGQDMEELFPETNN